MLKLENFDVEMIEPSGITGRSETVTPGNGKTRCFILCEKKYMSESAPMFPQV